MSKNIYWMATLLFAIVLFMISFDEKRNAKKRTEKEATFSNMLLYGIFFCLQDMFWGLCDSELIPGDSMLFFASSVFHLAIVFTSYFCLKFFLAYLGDNVKHKKIYIAVSYVAILMQVVLTIINAYQPILFHIEDGKYITDVLRPLSFVDQYVVYLLGAIVTLILARSAGRKHKDKYYAIFWVTLAPILTGIFQLNYPEAPFYSLGYLLECFIIYFFIISKERDEASQTIVLGAIQDTYYTMHLFDLKDNSVVDFIESELVTSFVNDRGNGQTAITDVMVASVTEEYLPEVKKFIDFSTVSERLKDSNIISMDFLGKHHGWTRATIISVERDEQGNQNKIMFTTQIIDEQKRREQEMYARSNIDQLTNLFNRRAYEDDVARILKDNQNLVYVSVDVNGLKVVNDSLGHTAGDELLKGAAECMRRCFGPYGKIYRTGGDEFAVLLYATEDELTQIQADLDETVLNWRGEIVDNVAISCGYVRRQENSNFTIEEMAQLADERMYKEKTSFYQKKGMDRKGQHEAHKALCALYTKILKINLTTDEFAIINMNLDEKDKGKGFAEHISEWLTGFAKSGNVHPDDMEEYLEKTNLTYMREYFTQNKTSLIILYRRKYEDGFKQVMMEMIPAGDYSHENQSLFLYVKNIDI